MIQERNTAIQWREKREENDDLKSDVAQGDVHFELSMRGGLSEHSPSKSVKLNSPIKKVNSENKLPSALKKPLDTQTI